MLSHHTSSNTFLWRGPFESRHLPQKAGFIWHEGGKLWVTKSRYKAYALREHADRSCMKRLTEIGAKIAESSQPDDMFATHKIPAPKGQTYYPFQAAGVSYMYQQMLKGRKAVGLFDEQGLGKSIQAIGLANKLGAKSINVVCPASLRLNWAREIESWHTHNRGVIPILRSGDRPVRGKTNIVSYELAKKLRIIKSDFLIVDETHKIKNAGAQRTKEVLGDFEDNWSGLASKSRSIFLSGTPLPNGKPNELWPLLFRTAPDVIDNMKYWPYVNQFCDTWEDSDGEVFIKGAKNKSELFTRLRGSGFMTRRLKKDVLKDLPDKRYKMVVLPQSGTTRQIIEKEKEFNAQEIIELGVPDGPVLPELRREMGIAKIPVCVNYISDMLDSGTKKLIVFAYHIDVIGELEEKLQRYNPVAIIGGTSAIKRQENVDSFQTDPTVRVMIGNLNAAGEGWTMTAAHDVVFVEASWVPGENDQCADRAHRIGQKLGVLLHFLVVQGSLDAKILGSAAKKKKDSKEVMDGV